MASFQERGTSVWLYQAPFSLDHGSASEARAFVTARLTSHGLSDLVADVQQVVSELATNAILHAQTSFTVTLQSLEDGVRLEVRDGSELFPSLMSGQSLTTSGTGVAIVQRLSHDWGVTASASGGKAVWALFATSQS